jgi:hypothetical protein
MFRHVFCMCLVLLGVSHETVGNDHHDVMCHHPSPASTRQFVYVVTSEEPVFAAGKLPANAISYHLHRPSQQACSCCFGLQDHNAFWQGLHSGRRGGAEAESHMRSAMRNLLWHKVADIIDDDTQYVILIDTSLGLPSMSNLEHFQSWLLLNSPSVGVPFHPCNMRNEHSNNSACILSVHDLALVAIRRTALKLLLPLDEAVFPLLCHVMLRGTVMQFDFGQTHGANGQSACAHGDDRDAANQDALVDFVSSLRSEELALAVPFSPRIQPTIVPRSVVFRSDGLVSMPGKQSSGFSCPVECSMDYWRLHPAFDCCPSTTIAFTSASPSTYDAQTSYIEISTKWNLPRRANLIGSLSDGRPSPSHYNSGVNRRYRNSLLTHPLPKFRIVLNRPPVVFDVSSFHQSCLVDAVNHLHAFKVTLQPDSFELLRERGRDAHVAVVLQVTVSSESLPQAVQAAGYAVFSRLESLRFHTVCNGIEASSEANLSAVKYTAPTDTEFSSGIAPWFYSPGAGWFEVASNITKEAPHCLRTLLLNVTVAPVCSGRMFISATASVALRAVSASGAPCISHVDTVSSHNVFFDAANETRRASFLGEDAPSDLFDDKLNSSCESTTRRSDFSCAGPNRMWLYEEQDSTSIFDKINTGEFVNMCLLHNVCWRDSRLVLYLPPPFANLEAAGLFDFPSLGIGNPWIGSDMRRFFW